MTLTALQGVSEDGFRHPTGSGAHEWWYFDAIDPASGVALVVIFFRGIPFSGARQRFPHAPADDFPAVAFSLYGSRSTELYFVNLHRSVTIGGDRMSIAIGENRAAYRDGVYEIELHDELLDGRSVSARFEFKVESARVSSPAPAARNGGAPHVWILAAPRCEVTGSISVDGTTRSFAGTGYHDHNLGERSLQAQFRHWRWGRAHFRDETFVYYEADGVSALDQPVRDETLARNIYMLRYAETLRAGGYRIRQRRIVDNGPFYLRFLSEFTSPSGQTVTGFSEVLRPRALEWKWFWPLLDSRVRPHRSGDRVGRKITQWLIQRGF
ncbi:MAG TPA: hypothetical protein VMS98_04020 [Thermoanaerobaculia bacterium]|nr:hypothetical protein [Thermoanaerobaculia bacterium]